MKTPPRDLHRHGAFGRFTELDGLRGIAAGIVVLFHLTDPSIYPADRHVAFSMPWGAYGVQLFFMISGFVILVSARNSRSVGHFAVSRFSRLYPAYWIALLLSSVLVLELHSRAAHEDVSWRTTLMDATMIQRWLNVPNIDAVYWTLGVELQFYALIAVGLIVCRNRLSTPVVKVVSVAWVTVSTLIAVWAYPTSHDIDPIHVAHRTKIILNATITPYGSLFCVGMLAFLARSRQVSWYFPAFVAVTAAMQYALVQTTVSGFVVLALCAVFLTVTARDSTPLLTSRPLSWLGKHSYSLYIGHFALGLLICHWLNRSVGPYVALVLALVLVFIWVTVLHRIGEVELTRAVRQYLLRFLDSQVHPEPAEPQNRSID